MNISAVLDSVRALAPERLAADWDNSGVQLAGTRQDCARVAVALDPTPEAMTEALAWGADLVITHHPLSFAPPSLATPGRVLDLVRAFMCSGAWLYSAHTSLDCRPGGPATWLGRALGLRQARVLVPCESDPEAGYGQVGVLPAPLDWDDFSSRLGAAIGRTAWTEMGQRPERVGTVACMPGSGASAMSAAQAAGAEVLITGDIKYHQALEAPLCVVDVGHHVLEEEMTRLFALELQAALAGVEVRFLCSADPLRRVVVR